MTCSTEPLANTTTTVAAESDRPTNCTLRTATASARGPDDDRRAVRELGQQIRRLVQHLLELTVRRREELADLALRRAVESTRRRQVIDEVAVSLVGRDPTGRRVRLDEEPLLFEDGQFAAHGRRRHLDRRRPRDAAPNRRVVRWRCTPARRQRESLSCGRPTSWSQSTYLPVATLSRRSASSRSAP